MSYSSSRTGAAVLDMVAMFQQRYIDLITEASRLIRDTALSADATRQYAQLNKAFLDSALRPTQQMFELMTRTYGTQSEVTGGPDINRQFNGKQQEVVAIGEEVLNVGIRTVPGAATRVRRVVKEVPTERRITLQDETISIERRPAKESAADGEVLTEREFLMIDTRQIPEVSKGTRVREELVITKVVTAREETVRDTLKVAEVEINGPQRMPAVLTPTEAQQRRTDEERRSAES